LWWRSIKNKPRHLAELAERLFSISPSQAAYERLFSILKWMLGDRHTNMSITRLEALAKIRSYYMTNIKSELHFYGKLLTEADLRECSNISSVATILNLEEFDCDNEHEDTESILPSLDLNISEIIDLTLNYNIEMDNNNNNTMKIHNKIYQLS